MRRGLAGLLFFVAAVCLALAAGGWWLEHVAFDTATSGDLADVVLRDPDIRNQIATVAADATAATLGLPAADVRAQVDQLAQTRAGSQLMRQIIVDSHARLIGLRDAPVQITGAQLVELTRNQQVADVPPVTLPVQEVPILSTIRVTLHWAVPIAAIAGGVALLLGLIAHPRKADAVLGIGVFCIVAAVDRDRARLRRAGVPAAGPRRHDVGRGHPRRSPGTPCPSSPAPRSCCWPSASR